MKKSLALVFAAVVGAALLNAPIAAQADAASDAVLQSQIQSAYDAQCSDVISGDFANLAKSQTGDYTGTAPNGTVMDSAKSVAGLQAMTAQVTFVACKAQLASVQQSGSTAVASVTTTLDGKTVAGATPLSMISTSVDTWTNTSGAWLMSKSIVSETKIIVNGKVLQDMVAPAAKPPR
ncbi:MAG TPA: nuclear transport factor 2 family protein [Candidatus Baltobacteraceae bacterium]